MNKTLERNQSLIKRINLIDKASVDSEFRAMVLALSAKSVLFWIDSFVMTYDPRETPSLIPFDLFQRQKEYIKWLEERLEKKEDGVADKCRDVGFTYLSVAFACHKWLFKPGVKFTFGSRKQDLVDRLGDPDSILQKARIVIENLPKWMQPKYDSGLLKIINRDNGSILSGEAGDQCGRGGRSTCYIFDEFAFLERATTIDAAISQNSDCKIYISTPNGVGNTFYKKRFSDNYATFTFSWHEDPRKNQDWFDRQKATLDPVVFAQEILVDYSSSVQNVVIPATWVQSAINLDLPYTLSDARIAGLDVADQGTNKSVLTVRQGIHVLHIESWSGINTTQSAYRAIEFAAKLGINHLSFDATGIGAGVNGILESAEGVTRDVEYNLYYDEPISVRQPLVEGITNLNFTFTAVNAGGKCIEIDSPEFGDRSPKEMFLNLRAQSWWMLRKRFERTFEYLTQGIGHHKNNLISIPSNSTLIAQLSQPTYSFTDRGLIKIESKQSLARRGISSPDFADSLILAFGPYEAEFDYIEALARN